MDWGRGHSFWVYIMYFYSMHINGFIPKANILSVLSELQKRLQREQLKELSGLWAPTVTLNGAHSLVTLSSRNKVVYVGLTDDFL